MGTRTKLLWTAGAMLLVWAAAGCATRQRGAVGEQGVRLPASGPLVVERSLRVAPGEYLRPGAGTEGLIRIEGQRGIEIDLSGVRLLGQAAGEPLELAAGVGIVLSGCDDVTIRGGELGGFLACLIVENCHGVTIEDMTFEGYRAERLRGTSSAADPADLLDLSSDSLTDWLELHGAAISVIDSTRVTVRRSKARRGQNGLLLLRSEDCDVYDNDFAFLSGWGVALRRSSDNRIAHNRLDYIARGYAPGGPREGYNAAAILLADRSARNTVAWNSATRCGYGALLHGEVPVAGAGAGSPARGGGSDDNLFYRNDFSHAIAQGMLALECRGLWVVANQFAGGHSGGLRAVGCEGLVAYANELRDVPGAAISLEGSRECLIVGNHLEGCDLAFQSRAAEEPAEGGAGRARREASRDHWLLDNHFRANQQDLVLERSRGIVAQGNRFEESRSETLLDALGGEGAPALTDEEVWAWLASDQGTLPSGRAWRSSLRRVEGGRHPWIREVQRFVPPSVPGSGPGPVPGAAPGLEGLVIASHGPWDFTGGGAPPPAAVPSGLLAGVAWDATWFRWDAASDPRGDLEAWRARRFEPLYQGRVSRWLDPWGGGGDAVRAIVGSERFGLIATARIFVPETGIHVLSVLSDDGVRVLVGGEVVYEDWTWHPARRDSAKITLEAGRHELRLEYFQLDGAAALALDLDRLPAPSGVAAFRGDLAPTTSRSVDAGLAPPDTTPDDEPERPPSGTTPWMREAAPPRAAAEPPRR